MDRQVIDAACKKLRCDELTRGRSDGEVFALICLVLQPDRHTTFELLRQRIQVLLPTCDELFTPAEQRQLFDTLQRWRVRFA